MIVTKDMLNEGLRGKYWALKFVAFMVSKIWGIRLMNFFTRFLRGKNIKGLHCEERSIPSRNGGPDIRVRIFKPIESKGSLPGMLYIHGGGYIVGNPEFALSNIEEFMDARDCVIVAPDYRKSLDAPYPAAINDCYDTLLWMKENATAMGVTFDRFIVAGHSAGGGLTAAVTLKARDTKEVSIAFHMPIYPMIDDRQITESAKDIDAPVWDTSTNNVGWNLYLKDLKSHGMEIPPYAAPARNADYTDFPPAITFVGDMEPFRDETIAYVENLKKAGVPVEFELYKGCFHGFETIVPEAGISKTATRFLLESFGSYVDKYYPPD